MNEEKSKSNNFGEQQPKKKTAISIARYTVLFTQRKVSSQQLRNLQVHTSHLLHISPYTFFAYI